VKPRIAGSHLAVDDAIGKRRKWIAEVFNVSLSSIEFWCARPPSPAEPDNAGRPSPLDRLLTLTDHCENPDVIQRFCADHWGLHLVDLSSRHRIEEAADALGYRLVPKIDTKDDSRLLTSPAIVAELVDALLVECRRRKPKMSVDAIRRSEEAIVRRLRALVADRLAKRQASAPHNTTNRTDR